MVHISWGCEFYVVVCIASLRDDVSDTGQIENWKEVRGEKDKANKRRKGAGEEKEMSWRREEN